MQKIKEKQNIPEGWGIKPLSELCDNLDNKRIPITKSDRVSGNVPYYGATGIIDYVDDYIFNEEILLVGEDGADWSPFANTAFVVSGKSWVNNHAHVLKCENEYTSDYLEKYLNWQNLDKYTTGGTRKKLNKEALMSISVLLPKKKSEQQKIAEILGAVDEDIAKTQGVIDATEKLKKGLMQQLFTRGIGHTKFKRTKLGEIPEEWEIVKLKEVARVERGKFSHRPRNAPEFYGGQYPFIQTGEVVNSNGKISVYTQTLNEKGLSVSKIFKKNTIVMTIAANIGDTAILEFDSCFPDSLVGITPNDDMDTVFLEYNLRTRKKYLNSIATQSAQKNINLQKLEPMLIIKPQIKEQQKIAEILSAVDEKISVNKKLKAKLTQLKKGLMQDLLSGGVRVIL